MAKTPLLRPSNLQSHAVFLPFQEKLEQYLFKLRIAERKGREAKVAKMHKKIDRMRRQLSGESLGSGDEGEEVIFAPCRRK